MTNISHIIIQGFCFLFVYGSALNFNPDLFLCNVVLVYFYFKPPSGCSFSTGPLLEVFSLLRILLVLLKYNRTFLADLSCGGPPCEWHCQGEYYSHPQGKNHHC